MVLKNTYSLIKNIIGEYCDRLLTEIAYLSLIRNKSDLTTGRLIHRHCCVNTDL